MYQKVEFETPDNIQVSYQAAGLGSRFTAWLIDEAIIMFFIICSFFLLLCGGLAADETIRNWMSDVDPENSRDMERVLFYFGGFFFLIMGLGSFLYFAASEFFWNGQTIGKARMKLRVVKSSGFALDSFSILIRNVFRFADNIPVCWIIPFINSRSQRMGDLVAGTIVISEKIENEMTLRQTLAEVPVADAAFRFNTQKLQTLDRRHFEAAERLVNRWNSLTREQQNSLGTQVTSLIANHFDLPPLTNDQILQFLKDLLAAEYRRQHRELG